MSTLREHGTAYLAMRRSLGYKLDGHGRLLMKFIGYLEDHGHSTITTEAALAWATTPAGTTQAYQNSLPAGIRRRRPWRQTGSIRCSAIRSAGSPAASWKRGTGAVCAPDAVIAFVRAAGPTSGHSARPASAARTVHVTGPLRSPRQGAALRRKRASPRRAASRQAPSWAPHRPVSGRAAKRWHEAAVQVPRAGRGMAAGCSPSPST